MKRIHLYQLVTVSAFALAADLSYGAAFRIRETNGLMGQSFAGEAAVVGDCSTQWNNPASMTYINKHVSSGHVHFIFPYAKFRDQGSVNLSGNNGGNAGQNAVVPALYGVANLHPNFKFGLGINSAWGLSTKYNSGWIGRHYSLKSSLQTLAVTPSLAWKINEQWSIGFGLTGQWAKVTLTKAVDQRGLGAATKDGHVKVTGDNIAFGAILGVMYEPWQGTRFGLSYHSQINHPFTGEVEFRDINAAIIANPRVANGPVEASLKTPHFFNLSASHDCNAQWTVLGDFMFTNWATLRDLRINRTNTGAVLEELPLKWKNTITIALGVNYKYDEHWKFRLGTAYDQSPIPDKTRHPIIPDEDRYWVSAGADYTFNNGIVAKLAYAHLFAPDPKINFFKPLDAPALAKTLKGKYRSHVDIISVSLNWKY